MPYFLAPLIGWAASGCLKLLINIFRYGLKEARARSGNGGFPSTHTSTISTVTFLIGLGEGWLSPAFGLGVGVLAITIIDATGLRIAVGKQAVILNKMNLETENHQVLRESMGHTRIEIIGGLVVGLVTSIVLYLLFSWLGWIA